jgi:hypothetical protein
MEGEGHRLPPLLGNFLIIRAPAPPGDAVGAAPMVKRFPPPEEAPPAAPNVGVPGVEAVPKPVPPVPNPPDGSAVLGVAGEAAGDPNANGLLLFVVEDEDPNVNEAEG